MITMNAMFKLPKNVVYKLIQILKCKVRILDGAIQPFEDGG